MCDDVHQHAGGFRRCPETAKLMRENLIKYDVNGRIVQHDGTELPRVPPGEGGVAHALRTKFGDRSSHYIDLFIDDRPALPRDSFTVLRQDQEVSKVERVKPVESHTRELSSQTDTVYDQAGDGTEWIEATGLSGSGSLRGTKPKIARPSNMHGNSTSE